MSPIRIVILAVAAVAAIGLAVVVRGMVGAKPAATQAAVAPAKPMARVLTAKRDLPVGTRIGAGDIGWQEWPVEALNPTFITDGAAPAAAPEGSEKVKQAATDIVTGGGDALKAFDGAVVKEALLVGEPITPRKVIRGGEGGYMSVVLAPGMRAVSIPVTVETGVGGFILPGDRVDVIQSRQSDSETGAKQATITETILRNIRVLAIDQTTDAGKEKSIVGAAITLEVPAGDTEALARAKAQGDLMLSLRAYSDAGAPSGRGPVYAKAPERTVRVIRAGQASEVPVMQ